MAEITHGKWCFICMLRFLLTELKLKMSEEQSCPLKTPQRNLHQDSIKETVKQDADSTPLSPSVEDTVDAVLKRLKEKRQQLNIPENIKVCHSSTELLCAWPAKIK